MNTRRIFVDPHVHIYDCFPLPKFFESAYANITAQARQQETEMFQGMLLLTESAGMNWFERLRSLADKREIIRDAQGSEWTCHHTDEKSSLIVQAASEVRLIIAAGRQIVTKEKIEVSALLTETGFPDGIALSETVQAIKNNGGIPAIPWGVGKWWGKRGRIISEFLLTQSSHDFFLGDNSGRPGFLPYPIQFKQAKQEGLRIVPGSDPLPIPTEYWRPGCAGFSLTAQLSYDTPVEDLKDFLHNPHTILTPYHQTESVFRFAKNILALQCHKR